jgi:thiosulfate dehydrogenase [quinone] large subunit
MEKKIFDYLLVVLRVAMGWIFFWAFLDKLFGLGFATPAEKSWLSGGSPTAGFLKFGTKGPLSSFYQQIAGSAVVDWLFMLGLLFVGITLLFGVLVKLGSYVGILMMILIYSAVLPPEHNPFLDEHIIYILVLLLISFKGQGKHL